MFCSKCGTRNPEGSSFCTECGARLEKPVQQPVQQPVPRPAPAPKATPAPRKSPGALLWVVLGLTVLAVAAVVILLVVTSRRSAVPTPDPEIIVSTDTPTAEPAPESPAPSPEVIIVTPSPLPSPTPLPATPTPAPTTAPPSAPGPVVMDKNTQYQVNVFLSNFSEQGFKDFDLQQMEYDRMIAFIRIYCKVNQQDLVQPHGGEELVARADVDALLNRFFGLKYNPAEGEEFWPLYSDYFYYYQDDYHFKAADGESYNKFTVVYGLTFNADGTYTADFQVYEVGLEEYWNVPGVDSAYYYMTTEEVSDMVWAERVTPIQSGTAILRPYDYNGRATYQLLKYEVWDIEFHMP